MERPPCWITCGPLRLQRKKLVESLNILEHFLVTYDVLNCSVTLCCVQYCLTTNQSHFWIPLVMKHSQYCAHEVLS